MNIYYDPTDGVLMTPDGNGGYTVVQTNAQLDPSRISLSKEGYLTLTKSGEETAKKLFERHTIISEFLMSLGVDEETATEDACRIEHVISDESFEAIKNRV